MPKVVVLILVLFASVCSTAAADPVDVTGNPLIQQSLHIAEAYWGNDPCNDQMRVEVRETPPEGGMFWGYAPCTIVINQDHWGTYQTGQYQACIGIVHEWGHALGFPHQDTNPDSPMYQGPQAPNVVPGCFTAFWFAKQYGEVSCSKRLHRFFHKDRTKHRHEPAPHRNCFRAEIIYN